MDFSFTKPKDAKTMPASDDASPIGSGDAPADGDDDTAAIDSATAFGAAVKTGNGRTILDAYRNLADACK